MARRKRVAWHRRRRMFYCLEFPNFSNFVTYHEFLGQGRSKTSTYNTCLLDKKIQNVSKSQFLLFISIFTLCSEVLSLRTRNGNFFYILCCHSKLAQPLISIMLPALHVALQLSGRFGTNSSFAHDCGEYLPS